MEVLTFFSYPPKVWIIYHLASLLSGIYLLLNQAQPSAEDSVSVALSDASVAAVVSAASVVVVAVVSTTS